MTTFGKKLLAFITAICCCAATVGCGTGSRPPATNDDISQSVPVDPDGNNDPPNTDPDGNDPPNTDPDGNNDPPNTDPDGNDPPNTDPDDGNNDPPNTGVRPDPDGFNGYYASVTATFGEELLGQVHDLITSTHSKYTTYDDCKTPARVTLTDRGVGQNTVMEFYTQQDISSVWNGTKQGTWNREHVWCQSLSNGLWGKSGGGSDMHHIRPSEVKLNEKRGNSRYGMATGGAIAYYMGTDGSRKYEGGRMRGNIFEPLDKVKGDVARIVMYVYAHYNTYANVHGTTNGNGNSSFFGKLEFKQVIAANTEAEAIRILLEWHDADPVDGIERARNEAVFGIQGNRNPFIDHPEYAQAMWSAEN